MHILLMCSYNVCMYIDIKLHINIYFFSFILVAGMEIPFPSFHLHPITILWDDTGTRSVIIPYLDLNLNDFSIIERKNHPSHFAK